MSDERQNLQNPENKAASEDALVEVRGLKKYFNISTGFFSSTPLKAVDDISFKIKKGETLGLVGELWKNNCRPYHTPPL